MTLFLLLCLPAMALADSLDVRAFQARAAYQAGDYATALAQWKTLAARGSTLAMNSIGNLYERGHGVPQSPSHALDWYRAAADAGDRSGQMQVGLAFELGRGVARDYREAARWYRLAAQQGHLAAQRRLGVLLATHYGAGVEHASEAQRREAADWLRRSAAGGHPESALVLQTLGLSDR